MIVVAQETVLYLWAQGNMIAWVAGLVKRRHFAYLDFGKALRALRTGAHL